MHLGWFLKLDIKLTGAGLPHFPSSHQILLRAQKLGGVATLISPDFAGPMGRLHSRFDFLPPLFAVPETGQGYAATFISPPASGTGRVMYVAALISSPPPFMNSPNSNFFGLPLIAP